VQVALVGDASDGTDFASREDPDPARRPQLVVSTIDGGEPPPPPQPPPGDGPAVFGAVADATAYSGQASSNFGSATRLVADTSPSTQSFLRFEVAGLVSAPTGARLRLWVTDKSVNGPEVRPVTSSWSEGTLTWATKPSFGSVVADIGSVSAGRFVEYDVSGLVTGNGSVQVALVGDASDGTDFASREDPDPARRPQLVVSTIDGGEPPPPTGDRFSFGLIGDTGYTSDSITKFLAVRASMNAADLELSVHIGDIKSGSSPCTDSVYTDNRDRFDAFTHPLAYTPGDNEWSDCSSDKNGRLAYLRSVFFADDQTRGTPSMTVAQQSAQFPENAMWHEGPVTFVTVHTVGSDNNQGASEFPARNAANIAWLQAAFDTAEARGSAGVVIATHANPGFPPDATSRSTTTGFKSFLEALRSEVTAWGKPVLFVHGDTHKFRVDQPTILGSSRSNFTRVEVYGPSDEHWVRVDVDPSSPGLFRVSSQ
jgi:hypothetical protein